MKLEYFYRFSKTLRMPNLQIFKNSSNVKFTDFQKLFEYQIYRFSKTSRMSNLQILKNSSNIKFTDFQKLFECQIYRFSKTLLMSNLQIFKISSNIKFTDFQKFLKCQIYRFSEIPQMSNFMKFRSVDAELFHADWQTDRFDEASRFSQFYEKRPKIHTRLQNHNNIWLRQHLHFSDSYIKQSF